MQLTARVSLRDGVSSLKARIKSLYHLGVKPVPRSTFADANNQRPASFYEALFSLMYRRCQPLTPKHKFKFKNKLFSLDATVVSLCLSLYPWASFRRTKGGIKLHTLLDRLSLALLSQVPVQLEHYFAKLHQDTTTQPFQDLHRSGTLRASRDDS
jgi:hypothetical protein